MRKLIVLLLMFAPMVANAQRIDKPGEPYDYFVTVDTYITMSYKKRLVIQWPDYDKEKFILDDNGNKIENLSRLDILLYMTKRGWEYLGEIKVDDSWKYFFKKSVTSDEQAKEFINFEDSKK